MSNWVESDYILNHKQWVLDVGLFILRVQDNGEGAFNWMVCPAEDNKYFSEDRRVAEGTTPSALASRLEAIGSLGDLMDAALNVMYNASLEES